ncbi:MAG: sporulation integral membrane protein YlbJ [Peptococcaceae bacterium]|jgi:sporulation integral membrane protein YlbJ|nr:sporulation integral membrane protein YlbJ [Peptococcaceae bacterium]
MLLRLGFILFLAITMLIQPQEVISGATQGLALWWQFVLPALLPFFILSELMLSVGFVRLFGVLLEPLMRPLFRLPGCASFVIAMGYTSGFPMGAILANRLYEQGDLTKKQAEHLIAFTNNPSLGFIFGAVAVGMMRQAQLGVVIAASVYLANLLVGLCLRFLHPRPVLSANFGVSFRQQLLQCLQPQPQAPLPAGQLLGQAIRASIQTTLSVGGFIVFFSVVIRLLTQWHIFTLLAALPHMLLPCISTERWAALFSGFIEMTIGCRNVVAAFPDSAWQVSLVCLLMGWNGLSILAQVAGLIDRSLSLKPYVYARLLHALLVVCLSRLFLALAHVPTLRLPHEFSMRGAIHFTWLLSFQSFLCLSLILCALGIICRVVIRQTH